VKFRFLHILFCLFWFLTINAQHINGVCIVGPYSDDNHKTINELQALSANWISLSPEAILNAETLTLSMEPKDRRWTNTMEGYQTIIKKSKEQGQKVFLKPHVVLENVVSINSKLGKEVTWRGDIRPSFFFNWELIEESYRNYIMDLATFAEAQKVEMLCIGTEMKSFVKSRPEFWVQLIKEVRATYSGQIIYSANWDNYENIPFWELLDFIGVNSYFPISKEAVPNLRKVNKKWTGIKNDLHDFSLKYQKQIIITEFGYRNVKYAGQRPWTHVKEKIAERSDEAQYNLLNAYFQSLWKEDWLAGGFLWNWNYEPLKVGNTDFSVQDKPAIKLVREFFAESL